MNQGNEGKVYLKTGPSSFQIKRINPLGYYSQKCFSKA